jgi:DnaJ-class molecular chaperone
MYCIQILGLRAANGQNTSILAEDIKKAYRKMAIKYHPDKQVSWGRRRRRRQRERKRERERERENQGDEEERLQYCHHIQL